jgi:glycosyltransferase involved in cell wall biosynthesis
MSESVIAIIPAYNEAKRLGPVVQAARPFVREVVVVDDGSTDDTGRVAAAAGARVVRHDLNRGKGAAIVTGLSHFAATDAAYAIFLDADGQHDPAEIPAFVAAAANADVVVGNRMQHTAAMPALRRWANRWTSRVTGRLAGQPVPDSQCGYRLLRRTVLPALQLSTAHFETETEMLIQAGRAGCRIASVPIRTIYEPTRHSRIRACRDTLRFLRLARKYWR